MVTKGEKKYLFKLFDRHIDNRSIGARRRWRWTKRKNKCKNRMENKQMCKDKNMISRTATTTTTTSICGWNASFVYGNEESRRKCNANKAHFIPTANDLGECDCFCFYPSSGICIGLVLDHKYSISASYWPIQQALDQNQPRLTKMYLTASIYANRMNEITWSAKRLK